MAGKVAKKGDAKAASGGKRGRKPGQKNTRKGKRTWTVYVYRTLKQIHKDIGMSSKGMRVVNSFVQDIFERIAVERIAAQEEEGLSQGCQPAGVRRGRVM